MFFEAARGGFTVCGIVGYTGGRAAAPILLEGLSRLRDGLATFAARGAK